MKMFARYRHALPLVFAACALTACGGGGDGGGATSGSTEPQPQARTITTLASVSSGGTFSVAVDGGRAYYSDYNANFIKSISIDGLDPITNFAPSRINYSSLWFIQKVGSNIYAIETADAGRLLSIPSSAVNANSATILWQGSWPKDFTSDDINIYWVDSVYHIETTSFTTEVYSQPIAGGNTLHIGTINSPHPQRIFQYNDALFIATDSASGGGIFAIEKQGGMVTTIVTTSGDGLNDILVSNDILYFTYNGIYSIDLNRMQITTLVPVSLNAYRMYIDDKDLYWTVANRSSGTGSVNKLNLSNPSSQNFETLYTGMWSWQITGDANSIYWAAGNALLKTTK